MMNTDSIGECDIREFEPPYRVFWCVYVCCVGVRVAPVGEYFTSPRLRRNPKSHPNPATPIRSLLLLRGMMCDSAQRRIPFALVLNRGLGKHRRFDDNTSCLVSPLHEHAYSIPRYTGNDHAKCDWHGSSHPLVPGMSPG